MGLSVGLGVGLGVGWVQVSAARLLVGCGGRTCRGHRGAQPSPTHRVFLRALVVVRVDPTGTQANVDTECLDTKVQARWIVQSWPWTYSAVVLERVLARCLQLRVKDLDQVAEHQVWKDDAALQSVVRGALFTCAAEVTHLAVTHPYPRVNLLCEVLCTVCGGVWVTDLRRSRSQILLQRRLRHLLKFALAATTCSERAHRCMELRLARRVSTDGR